MLETSLNLKVIAYQAEKSADLKLLLALQVETTTFPKSTAKIQVDHWKPG